MNFAILVFGNIFVFVFELLHDLGIWISKTEMLRCVFDVYKNYNSYFLSLLSVLLLYHTLVWLL